MKEHPILFSTEMVRAILDGRKTMTRRVITVPWNKGKRTVPYEPYYSDIDGTLMVEDEYGEWHKFQEWTSCPYGQIGDRLWVRETWYSTPDKKELLGYVADGDNPRGQPYRIRPSIFMPRQHSRITLEITNIRVERVQEITEEDARREGASLSVTKYGLTHNYTGDRKYRDSFCELWDDINFKKYPYESNPWVWVIEFKPIPSSDEAI